MECPVCKSEVETYPIVGPYTDFLCPHCGPMNITSTAALCNWNNLDDKLRSAIFYYLRVVKRNYLNNSCEQIQLINQGMSVNGNSYDFSSFDKYYPTTFFSKINMIMQLLSTQIKNFNESFSFNIDISNSTIKAPYKYYFLPSTVNEANILQGCNIIDILSEYGYVYKNYPSPLTKDQMCYLSLLKDGWMKIDSISQNVKSRNVFIAMSFDDSDNRIPIAENAIKKAIDKAGYLPMIIKDKQHNQSIPQQIDYEIRHSHFVITDLTLKNPGAYYEAGLAKGYGKEVIFTCHENDFDNIHFDTKQINTIKWSDSDKFISDLYDRIRFTIGIYES